MEKVAVRYINAGLELFKQSQLAIFDKALSLVDLFDTAVSDSVNAMQVIYPQQLYETRQPRDIWNIVRLFLEERFRHILVCFLFTACILCCTIFIVRHRRRSSFLEKVIQKANEERSPGKPKGGCYSQMANSTLGSGDSCLTTPISDRTKVEVAANNKTEEDSKSNTKDVPTQGEGDQKTEAGVKKNEAPNACDKSVGKLKPKTKPPGNRSLVGSGERGSTITNVISNLLNKKLITPSKKLKRRPDKPPQTRPFSRATKNIEKCNAQEKSSATNRAQVFILLSGMEKDNPKKKQPAAPRKRSKSPRKNSRKTTCSLSPKKQCSSTMSSKKNIPSLKVRKGFKRGQLPSPIFNPQDELLSCRQKQIANIPYLHTLPPKRPYLSKPSSRSTRQSDEKHKIATGTYYSPKSRMMAKDRCQSKAKPQVSKGYSDTPNKRCKTCRRIRHIPDFSQTTELLPMRKRTKDNLASLFCFSPDAILPAQFQNIRLQTDLNGLFQTDSKNPSTFSCAEDTNMNKAVLKIDLQNDNPNNHKVDRNRFEAGENMFLSTTSTNNGRANNVQDDGTHVTRSSNCVPCRIQHNIHPVEINETRVVNDTTRVNPIKFECYNNGNESNRHRGDNFISHIHQPHQAKQYDNRNRFRLDNQVTEVRNQVIAYDGVKTNNTFIHELPLKDLNGSDSTRLDKRPFTESSNMFQPILPPRLESTNEERTHYLNNLTNKHQASNERSNRCRKQKKDPFRESRKKCLYKNHSSKACQTFCMHNALLGERWDHTTSNTTLQESGKKMVCEMKPQTKFINETFDMSSFKPFNVNGSKAFDMDCSKSLDLNSSKPYDDVSCDMPTRRCDKIKSYKWRRRHEPYRFSPTKINSVAHSPEDFSNATYTIPTSALKTIETDSDYSRLYQPKRKLTDLAGLAHFTASTETSNDVSSSDIDPCTFSTRSRTSFENKNNCSPSRLAKPFIRAPLSETETAGDTTSNVAENKQMVETSSQCGGNNNILSPKSSIDWQTSGDELKQTKNDDNTFSIEESGISPTGKIKESYEFTRQKSPEIDIMQRSAHHPVARFLCPNNEKKVGSFKDVKTAMMFTSHRARNKSFRQNSLFKYPVLARKQVLRAMVRHAPKLSASSHPGPHNPSVSLGVQTSCTSLRHTAVQTSPIEEQISCRLRPGKFQVRHRTPNRTVEKLLKENHVQGDWLKKAHVDNLPIQMRFEKLSIPDKEQTNDKRCYLNDDDVTAPFVAKEGNSVNIAQCDLKIDQDNTLQHNVHVNIERDDSTIKDNSINTDADIGLKTHPCRIRRQSLPILSMSSSTCDVNDDGMISTGRDSSPPSISVLDSNSKDWLTRPKWENANVDEVNRRVERAMKLRQELQQYRSGKASVCSQETFKPSSLYSGDRDGNASSSKYTNDTKDGPSPQTINSSIESKYTALSVPTNNAAESTKDITENENDIQSSETMITVRNAESEATDTLVKTLSFNARPTESLVSENTSTEGDRKEVITYGDSTTETDTTSDTPERSKSHQGEANRVVPNSLEQRPSSTTSLTRNTTDGSWADDVQGNSLRRTHPHHHPITKNSPPIKISKMENVIQTEYPKLVGELVHALPHVPLASFVEWFIETSNPGQFISSDESTSTAADAKEVVVKEEVGCSSALESVDNERPVIYVRHGGRRDDLDCKVCDNNQQQYDANSLKQFDPSDILNSAEASQNLSRYRNTAHNERDSESVIDKTVKTDDPEGRVASIRRILLTRKDFENESSDTSAGKRRILTIRQTSSSSTFEGNGS